VYVVIVYSPEGGITLESILPQLTLNTEMIISILTGAAMGAVLTWALDWFRERRSVNVALEAEIERICEAIRNELTFLRGAKGTTIQPAAKDVTWLPFRTPVWDGLANQLGTLGSKRAQAVARFFGFFGFINEFVTLRSEFDKLGRGQEFGERYIRLLEDQLNRRPR
jgi:hypothetical protein